MIVLAVTTVSAEDVGRAVQVTGAQPPVFSSRAELVVAHITVKDPDGAYVTSLPQEAFRVFEDGAPQRIEVFTGEESPVTELFALAFNGHVSAALSPSMPFTSDAGVFRVALAGAMGAQGRTAMYDAVSNGLSYIAKGHHPRRVLVIVGDGGDNASTTTFDQVLREAQASNAAIYTVGIIDPQEPEANPTLLKRLAEATAGESFFPRDVNDVDDVLQQIADDIRHSYTLGSVSSNAARDGRFGRIRVVVTDPARRSLRVRTLDGYRAGGPSHGG